MSMVPSVSAKDFIVATKYKLIRKIGSGSFGDIYVSINVTNGEEVAIKLESNRARHPQLLYESKVYKILQGGVGIPHIRWYGTEREYNVLVMDLLGPSLEDLFNFCSRRFTMKTVLMLADQMIGRIEYVHVKNFIHRDIKPDNFLMGIGRHCNKLFLIDFGLAKKYRDSRTRTHIPYREDKNLTEDENMYCADCNGKSPRWAAWNLGIFICISCAGIHRNLGVHISKVLSVSLDSWTREKVVPLEEIGNARARAIYEATLPDGFRRPTQGRSMEDFIRAKYEHKRYYSRDGVPPAKAKESSTKRVSMSANGHAVVTQSNSKNDSMLLNFDAEEPQQAKAATSLSDPFGGMTLSSGNIMDDEFGEFVSAKKADAPVAQANGGNAQNLLNNDNPLADIQIQPTASGSLDATPATGQIKSNADIMALFASSQNTGARTQYSNFPPVSGFSATAYGLSQFTQPAAPIAQSPAPAQIPPNPQMQNFGAFGAQAQPPQMFSQPTGGNLQMSGLDFGNGSHMPAQPAPAAQNTKAMSAFNDIDKDMFKMISGSKSQGSGGFSQKSAPPQPQPVKQVPIDDLLDLF
ncbi:unnamed protein product, partial [Mesorhabditis spiculigera]